MAQQALRRQHDERQRIDEEQCRLPPQQVEVLRRGRAVGDADVDVGRELQEAFRPRARVVRALAFVRVRQQQDERRTLPPLAARRHQELVDDDLRAVDEVAVLRLPDHQARRLLHVVAVLEAEDRILGERAVVDLEGRARLRQGLQRHVRTAGRHVVQHGVAVAERSALDVLAGEADAHAVGQNRRQRQLFGGGPVDCPVVDGLEHVHPLLAAALELLVHREIGRQRQERRVQLAQALQRHGRIGLRRRTRRRRLGLGLDQILFRPQGLVRRLHVGRARLVDGVGLVARDHPTRNQAASPTPLAPSGASRSSDTSAAA